MKQAFEEIKEIMNKRDLAGFIVLASPERIEHMTEFYATWSCARYDGEKVHFNTDPTQFVTPEHRDESIKNTIGWIIAMTNVLTDVNESLTKLLDHLAQYFNVKNRMRRL